MPICACASVYKRKHRVSGAGVDAASDFVRHVLSRNTESAQSSIERKSSSMRAVAVLSGCAVTCG